MLITTSTALADYCLTLEGCTLLAVDTEFVRENTYYPKLCLIQLAGDAGEAAAIDVLADGIDLSPLIALLKRHEILKIFHAGRQDLEILSRLCHCVPQPLFDTQIAAQLLGFGDQIGYEALVREMLGKSLDKTQQYTNWCQRPLSGKQMTYALNDVLFLRELYPLMCERLKEKDRLSWMIELMLPYYDIELYQSLPEDAWERLPRRSKNLHYLSRLKMLAEFREEEAEERNLPRQWLFADETIQELALHPPKTAEHLRKMKLGKAANDTTYDGIMGALEAADPALFDGSDVFETPMVVPKESEPLLDLMKLFVKVVAEQERISPRLLATSSDLIQIALGTRPEEIFTGWRAHLFGEKVAQLLEGKVHLGVGPMAKVVWQE